MSWTENREVDVEELVRRVASGEIDYTIIDSTIFPLLQHSYPDAREAFAPIRAFARNTVLGGAILALGVFILSWVVSRRFVEPIVELEDASSRFAEGDDNVHLRVRGGDELGRLTAAFNRMVQSIKRQTTELTRSNQEIEGVKSVILRWGPDGAIRFINDFGCEHFGFDRDELIGNPLLGTIVEDGEEAKQGEENGKGEGKGQGQGKGTEP